MSRIPLIGAVALVVGGCHFRSTPVPVSGDPSSITALAGAWTGIYRGTQTERTGSITFTIRANADSAFGDVLMQTPPGTPMVQPADDPAMHRLHARGPQLLAIRFVAVGLPGGKVSATLRARAPVSNAGYATAPDP
jgi:hypothetical protein